jgi:hypothetical protein
MHGNNFWSMFNYWAAKLWINDHCRGEYKKNKINDSYTFVWFHVCEFLIIYYFIYLSKNILLALLINYSYRIRLVVPVHCENGEGSGGYGLWSDHNRRWQWQMGHQWNGSHRLFQQTPVHHPIMDISHGYYHERASFQWNNHSQHCTLPSTCFLASKHRFCHQICTISWVRVVLLFLFCSLLFMC